MPVSFKRISRSFSKARVRSFASGSKSTKLNVTETKEKLTTLSEKQITADKQTTGAEIAVEHNVAVEADARNPIDELAEDLLEERQEIKEQPAEREDVEECPVNKPAVRAPSPDESLGLSIATEYIAQTPPPTSSPGTGFWDHLASLISFQGKEVTTKQPDEVSAMPSNDEIKQTLSSLLATTELSKKETQPLGGPKYYVMIRARTGEAKIYHEDMPGPDDDIDVKSIAEEKGYEVVEYALVHQESKVEEESSLHGCSIMDSLALWSTGEEVADTNAKSILSASLIPTNEMSADDLAGQKYYVITRTQTGKSKVYDEAMPGHGVDLKKVSEETGYEVIDAAPSIDSLEYMFPGMVVI